MTNSNDRYFTSRIISDIEAQISAVGNSPERNILFAKKAFVLARLSQVQDSKVIIGSLRAINSNYEPRLSAWIMFAEGIIEHSETFDLNKSRDRILRAHLIGQVANDPALAATAAAWLAYIDFMQGKYQQSSEFVDKAYAWSTEVDTEARARAAMVIGVALYYSGDRPKAKVWLQRARAYAVTSGDIAMQNIIIFNASAIHVSQLTLEDCTTSPDPVELNFAVMSSNSSGNLNTALGIMNQPSMAPVQRAELLVVEKKWQQAIDVFDTHIHQLAKQGQSMWVPKFIAQRAWCRPARS